MNQDTFEKVYNDYFLLLRNYAEFILKDPEEAKDIVGDVFLNLWENRDMLKLETSPKAYLFKCTYNKCMDLLKHKEVHDRYADYAMHLDYLMYGENDYPLSSLMEAEITEILEHALKKLPLQCRKIFRMSRRENMTHKEIAKKLNISVNTVNTQINRALYKIRRELKDYLPLISLLLQEYLKN